MTDASIAAPQGRHLLIKLLDFERAPGRFPVALREPRALFEHMYAVMQLAAGRAVEGLRVAPANEPELQRAARFFVRTVMLRPGADPHTLLGLNPGFEPEQLREHYRLMIRLTHPDFMAPDERWPADAATRVNLAKDMLSATPLAGVEPNPATPAAAPAQVARAKAMPRARPLLLKPGASTEHEDAAERKVHWGQGAGDRAGNGLDDHGQRRWPWSAKLSVIVLSVLLVASVLLLA